MALSEKGSKVPQRGLSQMFGNIASRTSQAAGWATTFLFAALIIVVWAVTGPIFNYSDTLLVGDEVAIRLKPFDQGRRNGLVGRLTLREHDPYRHALLIDYRIDLGA